ncbi:S1 family peptidase [Croceitalea rosinachiae]|uniref:Serine protease n=1 Tax=Croceitalea rosinachiae TaxID=3075596 RepID=A0ABU3A7F2_9FLAO|nr:serine protease [Croceitalea sp. F388]MDT0606098.1 serine protease [Croceitalea sp. F388]
MKRRTLVISSVLFLSVFFLLFKSCLEQKKRPKYSLEDLAKKDSNLVKKILIELEERDYSKQVLVMQTQWKLDTIIVKDDKTDYHGLIIRDSLAFANFTSQELVDFLYERIENRQDYYLINKPKVLKNFMGVAQAIPKHKLVGNTLKGARYDERVFYEEGSIYKGCAQHFHNQYCVADFSAFAISKNQLLTVSHGKTKKELSEYKYVFDMFIRAKDSENNIIEKENTYQALSIDMNVYDTVNRIDFAVITVDKNIPEERILNFNQDVTIPLKSRMYSIGASEGLPLKYSPDGMYINNLNEFVMNTSLNVYGGNSGAPVFNEAHEVVGMVLKGQPKNTVLQSCVISTCFEGCPGEYILNLNKVDELRQFILKLES